MTPPITNIRKRIGCALGYGHIWGDWISSRDMHPRIVSASIEHLNTPEAWGRQCLHCGAIESRKGKP